MISRLLTRYLIEHFGKELKEQPGTLFFSKGVLEPPLQGRKVPDGASLDYIFLAAATALQAETDLENSLAAVIMRAIRRDTLFCVAAERCLMARIGGGR